MSRQTCYILIIFLLLAARGRGQGQEYDNPAYNITLFTDENGLPQNSVKSIAPDKNGFLWLATEFGLVRFDGSGFKNFKRDTGSLLSSRVLYILPTGKPLDYFAITGNNKAITANESMRIIPDTEIRKNIYLQGHLDETNSDIYSSIGVPNVYRDKQHTRFYAIPLDADNYFLIGLDSIHYYARQIREYSIPFASGGSLDFFIVGTHLYYLNENGVIYSIGRDGAKKAELAGDILHHPAYHIGKADLFWNILANQCFLSLPGCLYYIHMLPDGSLTTECVLSGFDFTDKNILSVYYDSLYKCLTMGSQTKGLFMCKKKQFTTLSAPVSEENVFYAHIAYDSSHVAIPQGYVMGLKNTGKKLNALASLSLPSSYSMLAASDSTIWIKEEGKVFHLSAGGLKLLETYKFSKPVTQIYEDAQHRIWIGISKENIYALLPGGSSPVVMIKGKWDLTCIQQESADIFWLGMGDDCYRFQLSTNTMEAIPGMKGKYVRSVYVPQPGEVWITTYEEGCYLYKNKKLTPLPLDKNRYMLTSHCMVEDKKGFFWITTNKGLFQASKQDLLNYADRKQQNVFYLYYEKSNGFLTNEFNGGCQPCAVKLANGYFSLPSLNGLVWFNPGSLSAELPDRELSVNKMEANGKEIVTTDTVTLPRTIKQLKFYISTPYFGSPYNLNIEYTLMNQDKDSVWLPLAADRSITLSALSSGTYHLVIRKSNGFGKDNYSYKVLTLLVPPRFYETWWFRLLMLVPVILLIWLYISYRTKYIRKKNQVLEERIASRTRELEQTLSALKISESDLRKHTHIQEQLITAMAHDIKSPLKFMVEGAKRVFGKLQRPGLENEQEEAKMLMDSGTRVYYYTESLLQYIRSQSRHQDIVLQPVDVFRIVEEKVNIFQSIAAEQGTVIVNKVPAGFTLNTNASLFGVVIHNLIDNAVKVTMSGTIVITAEKKDNHDILSITDSGSGMRASLADWCNSNETNRTTGHVGMGLIIIKELLTLLGAKLHVVLGEERGTTMQVFFNAESAD